jgi:glutathione S-transferase
MRFGVRGRRMTAMLKLYDYPLSGNCFKVRQMLAWLGVAHETVPVDFYPGREHKSAAFLANVNPLASSR